MRDVVVSGQLKMFFCYGRHAASRLLLMLSSALLVVGCVNAPTRSSAPEASATDIYVVENKSVDRAVREGFDAAMELLQQRRYEEGIALLNKVIQGSQRNSSPYINIAIAYQEIGDMKRAEESLRKALEINPDHPAAKNEYALLYRRTGRYSEARGLYEELLQQYPDFLPARKNLGILCELYLNDAPCALQNYETYSAANPNDETVKLWIAGLKQELGK